MLRPSFLLQKPSKKSKTKDLSFSRDIHPVECFPSWRRSHKSTKISSQSQTSSRNKKGKMFIYSNRNNIDITSLATASFVVDVNRLFDDVTDPLPRMYMPILLIREKNFSAYPRCDHRVWLISFFSNHLG